MNSDDLDDIDFANKLIEAQRLIDELTMSILKQNPQAKRESEACYKARIKKLIMEKIRASPELTEAAIRLASREFLNKLRPPH